MQLLNLDRKHAFWILTVILAFLKYPEYRINLVSIKLHSFYDQYWYIVYFRINLLSWIVMFDFSTFKPDKKIHENHDEAASNVTYVVGHREEDRVEGEVNK